MNKTKTQKGDVKPLKMKLAHLGPKVFYCQNISEGTEGFVNEVFPTYTPSVNDIVQAESGREYKVSKVVHTKREGKYAILAFLRSF